ncbi:MAG: hypothetical protein HYY52_04990 [Candidatus Melainabacteria bacterium]|nr:hypothetical protein [Candidatus Melainabacteria bacterium]
MKILNHLLILVIIIFSFLPSLAQEEDPCKQYGSRYSYDECKTSPDGDGVCNDDEDVVETICCCKPKKA